VNSDETVFLTNSLQFFFFSAPFLQGLVASGSGSWLQAPGVDVDSVAASISLYHGGE